MTDDASLASYVVSSAVDVTPKLLTGLLKCVPIVSVDFIDALAQRHDLASPLPDPPRSATHRVIIISAYIV